MRTILTIASVSLLLSVGAAYGGNALSKCDGDFAMIHGQWIATPACQHAAARAVVSETDIRIPTDRAPGDEATSAELCRRAAGDIRTATYCSEYND
jgi:hypothetical protein